MIKIEHLTVEQRDMLDMMWSLKTMKEFTDWFDSLDEQDQLQVETLQRMVILAEIDNKSFGNDMTEAKRVLQKFML